MSQGDSGSQVGPIPGFPQLYRLPTPEEAALNEQAGLRADYLISDGVVPPKKPLPPGVTDTTQDGMLPPSARPSPGDAF